MPIPKHIYQTCWTNKFHPDVLARFQKMRELNPDYTFHLFSDEDIEMFVKNEFGGRIYNAFMRINIPAAKVDFWRYLFLYVHGGIYLDIDADVCCSLNEIIKEDDSAIISYEGNKYKYVQWCLMFEKKHPILLQTIFFVLDNLENNRFPNNILHMTGPGVFTKAIQMIQEMNGDVKCTGFPQIHYDITDEFEWVSPNEIKYKIYGIDYGKKLKCCIVEEYDALYQNKTHWRHDKRDLLL